MSEPTHFRTREARENYVNDTTRQFKWLLDQYKNANSPEKKEKYRLKMRKWCDSHPTFTSAMAKVFEGAEE